MLCPLDQWTIRENSTFRGQVNVWGLKNSTTFYLAPELTWSTLGQVLEELRSHKTALECLWRYRANGMVLAVGATQLSDVYGAVSQPGDTFQGVLHAGRYVGSHVAPPCALRSTPPMPAATELHMSDDGMVLAVLAAKYVMLVLMFHPHMRKFSTTMKLETRGNYSTQFSKQRRVATCTWICLETAVSLPWAARTTAFWVLCSAWVCDPASAGCEEDGSRYKGLILQRPHRNNLVVDFIRKHFAVGAPGSYDCAYGPSPCANVKVFGYGRHSEAVWSQIGQELTGDLGFGRNVRYRPNGTLAVDVSACYGERL
jgi:hypothetical protein